MGELGAMYHPTPCFELETAFGGYLGSCPRWPWRFHFTEHFCEQLAERWGREVAEVLISLPRGRVLAANPNGHYAVELTGGILGEDHMIVILAAPDWHDPDSVAVVTVYPEWDGNLDAPHVKIMRGWGMQVVRRRPLLEVLERDLAH